MEIKIGITQTPRELVIDTKEDADDVRASIVESLKNEDNVLELADKRGRQYLVPVARISYVEIGEGDARRVGFTAAE